MWSPKVTPTLRRVSPVKPLHTVIKTTCVPRPSVSRRSLTHLRFLRSTRGSLTEYNEKWRLTFTLWTNTTRLGSWIESKCIFVFQKDVKFICDRKGPYVQKSRRSEARNETKPNNETRQRYRTLEKENQVKDRNLNWDKRMSHGRGSFFDETSVGLFRIFTRNFLSFRHYQLNPTVQLT